MAESIAEHVDNLLNEEPNNDSGRGTATSTGNESRDTGRDTSRPDATPARQAEAPARPSTDGNGTGQDEGSESDDGYTVDELEVDDDYEPEPPQPAGAAVSPELQYIVDNLPTLTVRGRTTPNGQVRTFQVKAPGQLPDSFEFANAKEQALFMQNVAAQENRARELQTQFQNSQQQQQFQQYAEQENSDIRDDIAELQREGLLPKYKYAPGDRRFDSDPAVEESQKVLDFMNEVNNEYAKNGRLYRISYRTAYDLLERQRGIEASRSTQGREDAARKSVTRQLAGATSAPSTGLSKPRIARSVEDLQARIDALEF